MESFYITLPSTASSHLYPNTQSHFRLQLPNPLELDGEWLVGLTEIHVPTAWNNVDDSTNSFKLHVDRDREGERPFQEIPIPAFAFEGHGAEPFAELMKHIYQQVPLNLRENVKLFSETTSESFQGGLIVSEGVEVSFSEPLKSLIGMIENGSFRRIPVPNQSFLLEHNGAHLTMTIKEPPTIIDHVTHLTIPHGLYNKVTDIIQAMRDALPKEWKSKITFKHNRDGTVTITCPPRVSLHFPLDNHGLGSMLGFAFDQTRITGTKHGKYPADLKRGIHGLYVYTDIISPHIVVDTFAPSYESYRLKTMQTIVTLRYTTIQTFSSSCRTE